MLNRNPCRPPKGGLSFGSVGAAANVCPKCGTARCASCWFEQPLPPLLPAEFHDRLDAIVRERQEITAALLAAAAADD